MNWSFVFPTTTASFARPELPDDLADQRPTVLSTVFGTQTVIESNVIADFAQVRSLARVNLLGWYEPLLPAAVPVGVRVRVSTSGY